MANAMVNSVSISVQNVQSIRGVLNQSAQREAFSEVLQRQTKPDSQENEPEQQLVTATDKQTTDDIRQESPVKRSTTEKESEKEQIPSGEEQNLAIEVLGQAAVALVTEITQYFEVDEEAILSALQDLQMNPTELLDPQALNRLLMQISDTPDSLTLLTNETLYDSFQTLQAKALSLLQQSAEAVQMEEGALLELAGEEAVTQRITVEVVGALQDRIVVQTDAVSDIEQTGETETPRTQSPEKNEMRLPTQDAFSAEGFSPVESAKHTGTESTGQNTERGDRGWKPSGEAPMVQMLQENRFENVTGQVESQIAVANPDTQDIMQQIMDYMRVTVKPDLSSIEMQLHPESLGTVQVQVANKGGLITAQFVTQNESVRAALESQMVTLRESFEEQGVKVEAIEVTVQAHQFESGYDQGARGGKEEPSRRNRTRRIQLDELSSMEDLDRLEMEERIAAEMLTANGGTIDYTA